MESEKGEFSLSDTNVDKIEAPGLLKQALVELTFPPTLRVARNVCDFHSGLPPEYTYSSISSSNPFDSVSPKGYRFAHRSGSFEMRLFEDSLTMAATSGYPGFETFRSFILEGVAHARQHFGITTFSRVGLRYENAFFLLPEEGKYRLAEFCTPLLNVGDPDVEAMAEFHLTLKSAKPNGGLSIRTSFRTEKFNQGELSGQEYGAYFFDFDNFRQGPVEFEALELCLVKLHTDVKSAYTRHMNVQGSGNRQ